MRAIVPIWLGRRPYGPLHELQQRLVEGRAAGRGADVVLLLEHEPVVTMGRALGRGLSSANVLVSPAVLAARGVGLFETGRGGDVTYHGPGQLVAYPVVDLRPDRCDVRRYVRDLAAVMVRLAADCGVGAGTVAEHVGVWVDRARPDAWRGEEAAGEPVKIGAIGVRLSRWVTMHGFAFNGSVDLDEMRSLIVPCGIADRGITSVADLVGSCPTLRSLAGQAAGHFGAVWGVEVAGTVDLSAFADVALEPALEALLGPGALGGRGGAPVF
ncbi:MAG: lipoyl(octanoyl) transferase LipB [Polyangiaceae bacterium]|nr:lipoyl(octanoyl) transferase LipB [Polyangiaceae bacterium]